MSMKEKLLIYQLLPRLFGNVKGDCVPGGTLEQNGCGTFEDITEEVLAALREGLCVTHVWYTGVLCHATGGDPGVKGKAGSPYAVKDYARLDPDLCRDGTDSRAFDSFAALVERTHRASMGVLIDFIPNHVARCYASETAGFGDCNFYPGRIYDYDWSDTVKLNYTEPDTWRKMLDILLFWLGKGVDGFRCDMVHLVPLDFWRWVLPRVRRRYPRALFVAEIYSPELYGPFLDAGFDYLYDKVGLYDTLRAVVTQGVPASAITRNWQQLGPLQERMLNFLENHDEQRIASDFFAGDPRKARAAVRVSALMHRVPFLIYAGQEFGERGMDREGFSSVDGRTSIFDYWSVSTLRRWLTGLRSGDPMRYLEDAERETYAFYRDVMHRAMEPVFRRGDTFDLQYANPHSAVYDPRYHFSFLRGADGRVVLEAVNFSPWDACIRIRIPEEAGAYFGLAAGALPPEVTVQVPAYDGGETELSIF